MRTSPPSLTVENVPSKEVVDRMVYPKVAICRFLLGVKNSTVLAGLWRRKLLVGSFFTAIFSIPLLLHLLVVPLQFNQLMIQSLEVRYGGNPIGELGRMLLSAYSSGLNVLSNGPAKEPPGFDNRKEMFEYVFSWLPSFAYVFPTEGFYYYSLKVEGEDVWGNFRAADLEAGRLSMAYFTVPERRTHFLTMTAEDGLSVVALSDHTYNVTYAGRTVSFQLSNIANTRPRHPEMLSEEEFVGNVHDESGVKFVLVFNNETSSFYYLLNESVRLTEPFTKLSDSIFIGERTGFMFFQDPHYDRKFLVGVNLKNVQRNNYVDGPGDQVPYRAFLRDKLHRAYPNSMLGDGVDEHGVYLNKETWQRLAICPYRRYASTQEVIELVARPSAGGSKSAYWTSLTKEWWNTPSWRRTVEAKLVAEGKQ